MKNIILFAIFLSLSGCGFYRTTDVTIKGTDIKSPYGTGSGDIVYHSNWGWGNANKPNK